MRVLFLGTPEFARVILGHLVSSRHEVVGCVSQPSRPAGRGLQMVEPPAVTLARAHGIPVFQPERLHAGATLEMLAALGADLFVTAAFGRLLRPSLLAIPPRGCWNVHTSLLPRHRGAAPAVSAILAGDAWTGVTIFQLDPGMDTGPLLAQRMTPIGPDESAGDLTARLAELGGVALVETLDEEEVDGPLPRRPQCEELATYSRLLTKEDGRIAWNRPALLVHRQVRAVTPWPGAFTFLDGARLRVHRMQPLDSMSSSAPPGTIVGTGEGLDVACGTGTVRVLEIQSEGRKRQPALEWTKGARVATGARFDG